MRSRAHDGGSKDIRHHVRGGFWSSRMEAAHLAMSAENRWYDALRKRSLYRPSRVMTGFAATERGERIARLPVRRVQHAICVSGGYLVEVVTGGPEHSQPIDLIRRRQDLQAEFAADPRPPIATRQRPTQPCSPASMRINPVRHVQHRLAARFKRRRAASREQEQLRLKLLRLGPGQCSSPGRFFEKRRRTASRRWWIPRSR